MYRQMSVLPGLVHQARVKLGSCSGFAQVYNEKRPNPKLVKLPAMDGNHTGEVYTCLDADLPASEEDYSDTAACPENLLGSVLCHGDVFLFSQKALYKAGAVYPKLLQRPGKDVRAMQSIDWLDVQTKSVTLLALVYSQLDGIFSVVEVDFKIDKASGIKATSSIKSTLDMRGGTLVELVASLVATIIFCIAGLGLPLRQMLKQISCRNLSTVLELVTRTFQLVFSGYLLVRILYQTPLSEVCSDVVLKLYEFDGENPREFKTLVTDLYAAFEELSWRADINFYDSVVACINFYFMFLQLLMYCSVHPRMGIFTATLSKAYSSLMHFIPLFSICFLMLAFVAHWQLGLYLEEFSTFDAAISSQSRMLFGEYIYANSADKLHGPMTLKYWLYAGSFMLVIYFLLLNFFLAIVVDAFGEVKKEEIENQSEGSFMGDCWAVLMSLNAYKSWPPRHVLLRELDLAFQDGQKQCAARDLEKLMPSLGTKHFDFLWNYQSRCEAPIVRKSLASDSNLDSNRSGDSKLDSNLPAKSRPGEDSNRSLGRLWEEALTQVLEENPQLLHEEDLELQAFLLARQLIRVMREERGSEASSEFTEPVESHSF